MNIFWLIFHYALLAAALIFGARWAWGKIRDKFTPGL